MASDAFMAASIEGRAAGLSGYVDAVRRIALRASTTKRAKRFRIQTPLPLSCEHLPLTFDDARALIAHPSLGLGGPQTWADLGAGDGAFTIALASLLSSGSVIHAIDADRGALKKIPSRRAGSEINAHVGDFTTFPWPFDLVDGVLMANALHYVADQPAFLRRVSTQM